MEKEEEKKHRQVLENAKLIIDVNEKTRPYIRGSAFVDIEERVMFFKEAARRGARSVEQMRTRHGRLVRSPSGGYVLTFRFMSDESMLVNSLTREMEKVVTFIIKNQKDE